MRWSARPPARGRRTHWRVALPGSSRARGSAQVMTLLVLSFSRAAVAELRRRITGLAGDARYVGVATFDSFATRILAAAEPDGPWLRLDYESRIRSAVDLLSGHRTCRTR